MAVNQDEDILRLLKDGDKEAFSVIFNQHSRKVYNYVYNLVGSKEEAEDIVQKVFLKVWEKRQFIDENKSFGGFLLIISRNLGLNALKKKVNERFYLSSLKPENFQSTQNKILDNLYAFELKEKIDKLINQLPKKRKRIFLMSRDEGLSYKEICRKLSITENTVNTQISLAIKYIKENINRKM